MVFHWSLSDSESPHICWTLLSILTDLNNAAVWTPLVLLIFKSFSPRINLFGTVPKVPITTGTTVPFMFHSFFNSLARSRYLSFFSLSFHFTLWTAGTAKFTVRQVLFSCWLLLSLVVWLRFDDPFLSQNLGGVCASHFPVQILGCAYNFSSHGQI